jgi:hypothetical protein
MTDIPRIRVVISIQGGLAMAIGVIIEIPGGTRQHYDQVMHKLSLGGQLPPQALAHVAGPIPGGWRVIDVWEDKEDFLLFVQGKLMKAMHEAGVPPVQPVFFQVYNTLLPNDGQQSHRLVA